MTVEVAGDNTEEPDETFTVSLLEVQNGNIDQLKTSAVATIGNDDDPREERNFVDDDGDGRVDNDYGHGTFVASLVLAVAPDARILPIRALDDEGFGSASGVASAIVWAVDQGADVVNFSIDMTVESEALKEAIDYARDRGVVIVGAAGNAALSELQFPARFDRVLAVGAVDPQGVGGDLGLQFTRRADFHVQDQVLEARGVLFDLVDHGFAERVDLLVAPVFAIHFRRHVLHE